MMNELPIAVTAFFVFVAIGAWRKNDWMRFGGALVFATIIISVARGADIWTWIRSILRWFGLNL